MEARAIFGAVWVVLLWVLEWRLPFFDEFPALGAKVRHDARNFVLAAVNLVLSLTLFAVFLPRVAAKGDSGFGLLQALNMEGWTETLVAFGLLDLAMYLWHRANHEIPILWRFHRMHHSEQRMNTSTALRFHPGEILLSGLVRLGLIPLLGIRLEQLVLYESVLFLVVVFHHSNLRLPRRLDHGLLVLLVTPAMHRVHHSRLAAERTANYGAVFPYWDRLLRTLRLRPDARTVHIGLDALDGPGWQTLPGMLRTPFREPAAGSCAAAPKP